MYHSSIYGYCNNDKFLKADYDAMVTCCIFEPHGVKMYVFY